ncbi:hypothetical protein [Sphingomonas abietis]|uniref:Uncharacterized protein n=1 Tax=Sphingomonas abietis TaxID=3012344 RepID=A0ABY7NQ02_9SPHN|nr:hypothetical protein [Sphingomonas abietis]WBO23603.1 hypothetical protein PBT88_05615 [Sphingomonas abietis]
MDSSLIRHVIDTADERGLTVEEALAHWQMAGGANAGRQSAHWVSIAFGIAQRERAAAMISSAIGTGALEG